MSRNKRSRNMVEGVKTDVSMQVDGGVPIMGTVPMYSVFDQMKDASQSSYHFVDKSDVNIKQSLEAKLENVMGQLSQQQSVNYMLLQKMTEMMEKINILERKIEKDVNESVPSYFS